MSVEKEIVRLDEAVRELHGLLTRLLEPRFIRCKDCRCWKPMDYLTNELQRGQGHCFRHPPSIPKDVRGIGILAKSGLAIDTVATWDYSVTREGCWDGILKEEW